MRSQLRAQAQTEQRRQRLQIGGGALVVAVIWTLALWPSGPDNSNQPTTQPRQSLRPWTTGPFIGTTPSTSADGSVPTSLASSLPTVSATSSASSPRPRATSEAAQPAPVSTTPVKTRAPDPGPTTPKGKRPTQPPGQPSPSTTADLFGLP